MKDRLLLRLEDLEGQLKDKDRALLHVEQIHRETISELTTKISRLEQDRTQSDERFQVLVSRLSALTDRLFLSDVEFFQGTKSTSATFEQTSRSAQRDTSEIRVGSPSRYRRRSSRHSLGPLRNDEQRVNADVRVRQIQSELNDREEQLRNIEQVSFDALQTRQSHVDHRSSLGISRLQETRHVTAQQRKRSQ